MGAFIVVYIMGVVLPIIVAFIFYMGEGHERNQTGARIILLSPIWPMLAPVAVFRGVRWLWRLADWKGIEEEEELIRRQRRGILHDY